MRAAALGDLRGDGDPHAPDGGPGLSDAGAHVTQFSEAGRTRQRLGHRAGERQGLSLPPEIQRGEDYASVLLRSTGGVLGTIEVGIGFPRDGTDGEWKIAGRDAILTLKDGVLTLATAAGDETLPSGDITTPYCTAGRDAPRPLAAGRAAAHQRARLRARGAPDRPGVRARGVIRERRERSA